MREFPYITVGKILQELRDENVKITRVTFYRLEERLKFPSTKKTSGKLPWRVYSREEADNVKRKIKKEYNIVPKRTDDKGVFSVFKNTLFRYDKQN